jgi:hypothetical protein
MIDPALQKTGSEAMTEHDAPLLDAAELGELTARAELAIAVR